MSEKNLAQPLRADTSRTALLPLLRRLHFYIGLFIAPFIFVAALTGTIYVLTPQLENMLYAHQLFTDNSAAARPLADQVRRAQHFAGAHLPVSAVRPASRAGETTRVMFTMPASGPSESTAVFIDPATLEIRGMLPVYGTSGVLPLRTWLDYLHRNLLLGEPGRNYSELAASWLWVAALGGVLLWATGRTPRRVTGRGEQIVRQRYWHSSLGVLLLLGLLFFAATGLTWSRWAGDNISALRAHFGWMTPAVNTSLLPANTVPMDEHAEHHMASSLRHDMAGMTRPTTVAITPAQFDGVLQAARAAGIRAEKIEIRPTTKANRAWIVSEIDRRWPTRVDSVAVDPVSFRVVDKVTFAQFGLLAKLTRWGVDAHMGVLFGLANQLLLAAFGLALCVLIVLGYRLWWLRRPTTVRGIHPAETLIYHWRQLGLTARFLLLVCTVTLAIGLPVMGISLLVLLLIDVLRWQRAKG